VALFGLTPALRSRLGRLAAAPDSFVFLGSSTWDRASNAALRDLQVSTIARLRADGVIPQGVGLAFKGHPANAEHEGAIMAALGDDVVHIPARIPLEVLEMDGVLPGQVGGMLSTSFVTLTPGRVRFLVSHVFDPADLPLVEDVALFVDLGVVRPEQVHPWYA
jgi:hypothetical protein